jgi:CheY-like chemotaxis protein
MRGRRRRGERLDEVYRGLRGAQQCAAPVGPSWPSPTRALPLRCAGFELRWQHVKTASDLLARLAPPPDIILADYTLPQFDALCALRCIQERAPDIPLIVVTSPLSDEAGVACVTQGAADYLLKDLSCIGSIRRLCLIGMAPPHDAGGCVPCALALRRCGRVSRKRTRATPAESRVSAATVRIAAGMPAMSATAPARSAPTA